MQPNRRTTMRHKKLAGLLLALTVCLLPLIAAQAESAPTTNATVYGSQGIVNVRANASMNARVIAKLANGKRVNVLWNLDGWFLVEFGSTRGYIADYLVRMDAPAPVDSTVAYVRTSGGALNVRAYSDNNSKLVGKLRNGTKVSVFEKGAEWCRVQAGSIHGYVAARYLSFDAPAPATRELGTIYNLKPGSRLNLRKQPSTSAPVLAKLPNGQIVEILSVRGDFCKVSVLGITGYVARQYVMSGVINPAPVPPIVVDPVAPVIDVVPNPQPTPPVVVDPSTPVIDVVPNPRPTPPVVVDPSLPVVIDVVPNPQPTPPVVVDPSTPVIDVVPNATARPVPPIAE